MNYTSQFSNVVISDNAMRRADYSIEVVNGLCVRTFSIASACSYTPGEYTIIIMDDRRTR